MVVEFKLPRLLVFGVADGIRCPRSDAARTKVGERREDGSPGLERANRTPRRPAVWRHPARRFRRRERSCVRPFRYGGVATICRVSPECGGGCRDTPLPRWEACRSSDVCVLRRVRRCRFAGPGSLPRKSVRCSGASRCDPSDEPASRICGSPCRRPPRRSVMRRA